MPATDIDLEAAAARLHLDVAEQNRRALLDTMRALCAYAVEARQVLMELDLNPVILTACGRAVAVDALVVLAEPA